MKNKSILMVIVLILIAGIGFTKYTKQYVSVHQVETTKEMLTTAASEPETAELVLADTTSYQARLEELDQEIERLRTREKETAAGHSSAKVRTENEWRLWQTELDRVLELLEKQLPLAERDELFQEQRNWVRDRETRAVAASTKQNGAALEEVEYNKTLAADTRARVYELVKIYGEVLQ